MSTKKIVVSGANGQLGKSFQKVCFDWPEFEFHFLDSEALNVIDDNSIQTVFEKIQPDYFINCAAYTSVDLAETEREQAYSINAESFDSITAECIKHKTLLIHFSSDYVYDNGMTTPMNEESPTTPKSIYAQSKLMGEEVIQKSPVNAIIIRTSWVYSEFGHNFLKSMLRLGKEKSILNIVNDQIGCPTYAPDIANAAMKMIIAMEEDRYRVLGTQIFNFAGEGEISWFDFAAFIFKHSEISIELNPIPSSNYPTPATRPKYSILDMTKIKKKFGIAPRFWKEPVKECIFLLS